MPCFSRADTAAAIAAELIPLHHKPLADADVKIAFIFRDTAGKRGGKIILGKTAKQSPRNRFLTAYSADVIIELGEDKWDTLSDLQRRALVDHELCHLEVVTALEQVKVGEHAVTIAHGPDTGKVKMVPDFEEREVTAKDDDGRPKLKLREHDIAEFNIIIERHGLWNVDLMATFAAMKTAKVSASIVASIDFSTMSNAAVDTLYAAVSEEHRQRLTARMDQTFAKMEETAKKRARKQKSSTTQNDDAEQAT